MRRYFLYVFYFNLGFLTSVFHFAVRKDLQEYGLSIPELAHQLMFMALPWSFKCIMAWISDTLVCCGFNRKPYIVGCNVLCAVFCYLLMIDKLTLGQYTGLQFGLQLFFAWVDVVYDAVMIYEANLPDSKKLLPNLSATRTLGRLLGHVGPKLWEVSGSDGVFGTMSASYFVCAICSVLMVDVPRLLAPPGEVGGKGYYCKSTALIFTSLRHPILQIMLVFNILTGLIPSAGTATFYFLNDVVNMSPSQVSALQVIGDVTGLLATLVFEKCFMKVPIRILYGVVCIFKLLSGFLPYMLSARETDCGPEYGNGTCYYYEKHRLDPFPLAMGDNVLGDALDTLQSMPLNIVVKGVCFHVLGATVYTFTLAVQNLVSTLRIHIDAVTMQWFGIDHGQFEALADYIIFCNILDIIGFLLTPILPKESVFEFEERVQIERYSKELVEDIVDDSLELGGPSGNNFSPGAPPGTLPQASIAPAPSLPDGTIMI